MRLPSTSKYTFSLALLASLPALAMAQAAKERPPATVRVSVTDSAGAPVSGAEVTLRAGLAKVLSTGTTNESGAFEFRVPLDSEEYSVTARKIGFARGDRFISAESRDIAAHVTMKHVGGTLAPVTVTAEDPKRHSYFIDADGIANSDRGLIDALDVVARLRPDMMISRSGTTSRIARRNSACPPLQNIWVNGKWVRSGYVVVNELVANRLKGRGNAMAMIGTGNASILSQIAPEHIAEMKYLDCFEQTDKVGGNNALYIVLKEGVGFTPSVGTYVVGDSVATSRR